MKHSSMIGQRKMITSLFFIVLAGCTGKNPFNSGASSLTSGEFISSTDANCESKRCVLLRKEFDYVVSTGNKIYCYWDLKKEITKYDYTIIARDLKNSITDTTSTYEYYLILQKWAGSLYDGHVNAMWGDDLSQLESYKVPVTLDLLNPGTSDEKLIVATTGEGAKEIPVGAIVTKINDTDAMEYLNEVSKYASGSTLRMKRKTAARLIFSIMKSRQEETSSVKLEYSFKEKISTLDLPRNITLPVNPDTKNTTDDEDTDYAKIVQAKILPNNIGYLRIDQFSGKQMPDVLTRTMKMLSKTKALIIDVRKNGGGDQSADAILSLLAKEKITRYSFSLRISELLLDQRTEQFLDVDFNDNDQFTPIIERNVFPSTKQPYAGKVYALTSTACFSACDTFVSALKQNKLATILGEATGGGTGTPFVFSLQYSGLKFRYSVARGFTATDKTYIEGNGTLPDIEILPTLEERIAGNDQQLLAAINLAARNTHAPTLSSEVLKNLIINSPEKSKDSYTLFDYNYEIKKQTEL